MFSDLRPNILQNDQDVMLTAHPRQKSAIRNVIDIRFDLGTFRAEGFFHIEGHFHERAAITRIYNLSCKGLFPSQIIISRCFSDHDDCFKNARVSSIFPFSTFPFASQ